MKKLILTISLTAATIIAFAQNYGNGDSPTITFGIVGGSNYGELRVKAPNQFYVYTDFQSPFTMGLSADFRFNDYFSIMPEIIYAGKGGSVSDTFTDSGSKYTSVDNQFKLHYLEVPVVFIGHIPVGEGASVFLGTGPYIALGMNGTNLETLTNSIYLNVSDTQKIKYGSNGDFKSTDFGATSVLGFQAARGWSVSFNLDYGLANIIQNNTANINASQMETSTLYLSFGYRF